MMLKKIKIIETKSFQTCKINYLMNSTLVTYLLHVIAKFSCIVYHTNMHYPTKSQNKWMRIDRVLCVMVDNGIRYTHPFLFCLPQLRKGTRHICISHLIKKNNTSHDSYTYLLSYRSHSSKYRSGFIYNCVSCSTKVRIHMLTQFLVCTIAASNPEVKQDISTH